MVDKPAKMDKKIYKKCIRCREWKPKADIIDPNSGEVLEKKAFGMHADTDDGLQVICFACKNKFGTISRNQNVRARIRHHTGTRCLTQLGDAAPPGFVADIETHLGYRFSQLVKHLGHELKSREGPNRKLVDVLNDGYHIDHIEPLSSYKVVWTDRGGNTHVDWDEFRRCWRMQNLRAIPAKENLQKGAKRLADDPDLPTDSTLSTVRGDTSFTSPAQNAPSIEISVDSPLDGTE